MRIAVVTNPRSRESRRDPGLVSRIEARLEGRGRLYTPTDLGALAAIASELAEADLLAIHGGDGTLHQVFTAILRAVGEGKPLPKVAVLRGGTMNIVATSIGISARPEEMLDRILTGEPLQTVTRPLLRVEADSSPPHYGFLSGGGIVARFLELYYDTEDPTPLTAALLLLRGSLSAVVRGSLAARLTRPYLGSVTVDGTLKERREWLAVVFGSVEELGLRFRVFHLLSQDRDSLQVIGIGSTIGALARELPSLYRGRGVHHPDNFSALSRRVDLAADEPIPLMIDGDFLRADGGRVSVSVGPAVSFVVA